MSLLFVLFPSSASVSYFNRGSAARFRSLVSRIDTFCDVRLYGLALFKGDYSEVNVDEDVYSLRKEIEQKSGLDNAL